jgi:hypothetical protein
MRQASEWARPSLKAISKSAVILYYMMTDMNSIIKSTVNSINKGKARIVNRQIKEKRYNRSWCKKAYIYWRALSR